MHRAPMIDVRPLLGIFVGGRGSRMGGVAKGLLPEPHGTRSLVARLVDESRGLVRDVVLVGAHEGYEGLGLRTLADARAGCGPLAGLVSLLREGREREGHEREGDEREGHEREGHEREVIALACDLPFVDRAFLARLVDASREAAIVAPRRDHGWEPLAARYRSEVLAIAEARLADGALSLQGLLHAVGATELPLEARERSVLDDWDSPEDVARPRR